MNTTYKLILACMIVLVTALPTQASIVSFNGAIDLTLSDWQEDGASSGISTFDVYEVYLLGRVDVSQSVAGYFELRCEHSAEAILRQGYLQWTLSEPAVLTMGYFYAPVGQYWKYYYASTRLFASYVYAMRMINVTPWGDAGMKLSGEFEVSTSAKFNYALAVINGLNSNYIDNAKPRNARQTRDNNENKMIAGRIGFAPVEELEVGFSYANGKYDDEDTRRLQFINADIALDIADFTLKGEWVQSEADTADVGDKIKSSGFYVHAGYKILKDKSGLNYIMPVVRYEQVDPGREMKDRFTMGPETTGKITAVTVGLNVSPYEHFLLKAEYRWTMEELDPQLENDAFFFQACIDF